MVKVLPEPSLAANRPASSASPLPKRRLPCRIAVRQMQAIVRHWRTYPQLQCVGAHALGGAGIAEAMVGALPSKGQRQRRRGRVTVSTGSSWQGGSPGYGDREGAARSEQLLGAVGQPHGRDCSWRRHYNTVRPHSSLGYRPLAPETAIPPSPPSGSASLHLHCSQEIQTNRITAYRNHLRSSDARAPERVRRWRPRRSCINNQPGPLGGGGSISQRTTGGECG